MLSFFKELIVIAVVLLILIVSSCGKEEATPIVQPNTPTYWGEAFALINEQPTNLHTFGVNIDNNPYMSISIDLVDFSGYVFGGISFDFIPFEAGKHILSKEYNEVAATPFAAYHARDDDAIMATYHLVDRDTLNYIELTYFDNISLEISGKFETVFAMDSISLGHFPELEDTLIFTQGQFQTKLYKY